MNRRHIIKAGGASLATAALGGTARAQATLPDRPIRIVVSFAAGGSTDGSARLFAEKFGAALNRTVINDNRTGAAGAIAITDVATAAPDGGTLLYGTATTHIFLPAAGGLREDPMRDVPPLSIMAEESCAVAVHRDVPVTTLKEFIDYLKARPGEVNYGTSGVGGMAHYASEMLDLLAGTTMTHVPYKGGAQLAPDWAANRVQLSCGSLSSSIPFYREGRVKILAVCSEKRVESFPEIPTAAEAGLPGFVIGTFQALCASSSVPKPLVQILSQASRKAVANADFRSSLTSQGIVPLAGMDPDEAVTYVKQLAERVAPVIKAVAEKTR